MCVCVCLYRGGGARGLASLAVWLWVPHSASLSFYFFIPERAGSPLLWDQRTY